MAQQWGNNIYVRFKGWVKIPRGRDVTNARGQEGDDAYVNCPERGKGTGAVPQLPTSSLGSSLGVSVRPRFRYFRKDIGTGEEGGGGKSSRNKIDRKKREKIRREDGTPQNSH